MDRREQKAVIEGLLFLWGEPLSFEDIGDIISVNKSELKTLISEMQDEFDHQRRGLVLEVFDDHAQLTTRRDHYDYFANLVQAKKPSRLTNSSLETLSIIAYKQPITRIEVDNIRGVKSTSSFETLMDRGLIEECGRLDQVGRPILYRTSLKFLQHFGLTDLKQLPDLEELAEALEKFTEDDEVAHED